MNTGTYLRTAGQQASLKCTLLGKTLPLHISPSLAMILQSHPLLSSGQFCHQFLTKQRGPTTLYSFLENLNTYMSPRMFLKMKSGCTSSAQAHRPGERGQHGQWQVTVHVLDTMCVSACILSLVNTMSKRNLQRKAFVSP